MQKNKEYPSKGILIAGLVIGILCNIFFIIAILLFKKVANDYSSTNSTNLNGFEHFARNSGYMLKNMGLAIFAIILVIVQWGFYIKIAIEAEGVDKMWFIFGLLVPLIAIIGIIYCLVKVAQQDLKVWGSAGNNNDSTNNKPENTPNLPPQY